MIYFGFYRICGEGLYFGAFICFDVNYLKQCNQVGFSCFQSIGERRSVLYWSIQGISPHGFLNSPHTQAVSGKTIVISPASLALCGDAHALTAHASSSCGSFPPVLERPAS